MFQNSQFCKDNSQYLSSIRNHSRVYRASDSFSAWRVNTIDSSVNRVASDKIASDIVIGCGVIAGPPESGNNNDESSMHDTSESSIRARTSRRSKDFNTDGCHDTSSTAGIHQSIGECSEANTDGCHDTSSTTGIHHGIGAFSESVDFMVRRDYNVEDVTEMYPFIGVHHRHEHSSNNRHTPLDKSRHIAFVNSRDASGVGSTSSDDRLSLPTKGQDNSNSASNSLYHAGSQLKVYSGEFKSSASRSKILTEVSDGQAGFFIGNNDVVGGLLSDSTPVPALVARIPADKYSIDSMGVLPCRPVADYGIIDGDDEVVRNASIISDQEGIFNKSISDSRFRRSVASYPAIGSSSAHDTKHGGIIDGDDDTFRNTHMISDQKVFINESVADSIFQWLTFNDFAADIRSMGEIISNLSDLAIVISADEVEAWTQEAGEILNEKIPRVADVEELMAIDYNEVMDEFKANRESSIDNFIHSTAQPCRLKGRPPEALRQYLKGYEDLEILIDLLSHGQRSFLHENFKANGGNRVIYL